MSKTFKVRFSGTMTLEADSEDKLRFKFDAGTYNQIIVAEAAIDSVLELKPRESVVGACGKEAGR